MQINDFTDKNSKGIFLTKLSILFMFLAILTCVYMSTIHDLNYINTLSIISNSLAIISILISLIAFIFTLKHYL